MTAVDGICECCGEKKDIVGVACVPGVPISIAWCADCLRAGAIPYGIAVANTACCGGLDATLDEWRNIVEITLKYFHKTLEEFTEDVNRSIKEMEEGYPR